MSDFKKGDTVKLKSGGPLMTVANPQSTNGTVYVVWFAHGNQSDVKSGNFAPETLELSRG